MKTIISLLILCCLAVGLFAYKESNTRYYWIPFLIRNDGYVYMVKSFGEYSRDSALSDVYNHYKCIIDNNINDYEIDSLIPITKGEYCGNLKQSKWTEKNPCK